MESASSLWIYGKPGCGKTVLSSVIISDLKAFENDTQHLLFFFFSFTDSKKQSLDGAVRSLTSQLSRKSASARAHITSTFSSKYEKSLEQPSTAQLCEIFECMLQRSNDIWIVLDALDECQLGSTFKNEGLLSWLQSLLTPKHDNVRTLVTGRREHNIRMVLDGCIPEQLCLQSKLVAGDIQAFIDQTIKNWDGLSIWQEHEWVQEEIRDYLTKNSDGMFRWVSCQLDALAPLQGCRDHQALIATLESLPKSLDGIYARMLDQIPEALRAQANRILQFLLYSEIPLHLEEVVEIAVFSPKSGNSTCRVDNSIKPEKDTISLYCPNLVECVVVNEGFLGFSHEVLQLAHCSVRDFLLSDRREQSTYHIFQPRVASGSLAEICLSYLLDIGHDQPLDQILSSYPLAVYAACFWTHYAKRADASMVLKHIREFVRRQDCYETYCRLLDVLLNQPGAFRFVVGAEWVRSNYYECPMGKKSFLSHSMLDHFAMRGLMCAVEEILHKNADAIGADGVCFSNALQEAAHAGHKDMICLLLGAGANPNAQGGEHGSALQAAINADHREIFQILLNAGANITTEQGQFDNALQAAAKFGHQEAVRVLLDAGTNPNSKAGCCGSPLNAAIHTEKKDVIHMLLAGGADPNVCGGGDSGNALHTAAYRGNPEIMEILLDAGADTNAFGGKFGNSLSAAIAGNHRDAVEMLLNAKANVNGHRVFYTAAKYADIDIIELLLRKGSQVDEKALWAAFEKPRDREVIKKLLENITLTGSIERCLSTELSIACQCDRHGRVQMLLDAGANVNMPMNYGDTALYIAASRGLEGMFELFLDKAFPIGHDNCTSDGLIYATSLTDCTNIEHLLSMQAADAKTLLSKALACTASSGSRRAVRLLAETCQAYHQAYLKAVQARETLNNALEREIADVKNGCDSEVELLLVQGADPNLPALGDPSLCYLIKSNKFGDRETLRKVMNLLLDYGADATKHGPHGCAIDVALRERRWELVGILRDRGVEKTQMYRFMEAKVNRELRRLEKERVKD